MTRHLGVVFRGTGGVIGQDYVSRTLQACSDLVEEVNPEFPATMGGLPVGEAGDINDPSMAKAVEIAVEDAKHIIAQHPDRKLVIGGYSAGAVAAAHVRQYVQETCPDRYVCSFSFGDPTRPKGGAFFAGKPAPGHGISTWRYGDIKDWRHCWLAAPGDMYASVPDGDTGLIMGDFYDIVTNVELSDPVATLGAILRKLPDLLVHLRLLQHKESPVSPGLLGLITETDKILQGRINPLNPLGGLLLSVVGLLDGEPDGLAAGINAALEGIRFVAQQPPTAPHIQYENREVWPGQTYLGLAIQHVRDWSSRT
ncbi:lysin B [Mycobacterium phage TipsytheTRex]|nr:lysin B [Mycobacterium phage TipsytheTRex]